jgi:2-desacetyl-2-hydroxyethyl bacteriochlorophyllide A dehydrogenase
MTLPTTTLAATLVGPKHLEIRETALPELGSHDVLTETFYSGISAGTEMNVYRGRAPQWSTEQDPVTGLFRKTDHVTWTYPLAYGYAAVGRVLATGEQVTSVRAGDTVFTYSPHQQHAVTPEFLTVLLPELTDLRAGVLNANLNTALNGVLDARVVFGDVVVVSGLGVLGLLITQMVRQQTPALVIGVDPDSGRRALAEKFGADLTLDPRTDQIAEEVRARTGNRGADVVIEVSGVSSALNEAIRTVGKNARVIAMSWYGGTFESLSLSGEFHHNRPMVISSQVGMVNPDLGPLWDAARRQQVVNSLFARLDTASLLTTTVPFTSAAEAYAAIDEARPGVVQTVLDYRSN